VDNYYWNLGIRPPQAASTPQFQYWFATPQPIYESSQTNFRKTKGHNQIKRIKQKKRSDTQKWRFASPKTGRFSPQGA